jgi:hypothetical protein
MNKLIKKLNIDETYTKPVIETKFNKVKDNIPHVKHYNYMADLLQLPETKDGYNYVLVVVDLATDMFDIEPIKNNSATLVLEAFKKMFKRKYIKKPHASVRTDGGAEFKKEFTEFLYDNSILHKTAEPYRHKQLANVESLNKLLGRLFNGYMNYREKETGKIYKEWNDVIETIRKDLNEIRKKEEKDRFTEIYPVPEFRTPKFKVDDLVYYKLDYPENALGQKQPTPKFRAGDYRWHMIPTKIKKVLFYSGDVPIRYLLNNKPNVSYAESELKTAKEKEEKFIIERFLGVKTMNKKKYYKVKWKNYKVKESNFEEESKLIKDIGKESFDEFVKAMKKK